MMRYSLIAGTMLRATLAAHVSASCMRAAAAPALAQVMPRVLPRMLCGTPADRTVVKICQAKITLALDAQEIEVKGAFDDPNGSHITIYCVSDKFEGKRTMQRQQMVYKAIWEELQGERAPVHAVDQMVLKAPSEL